MIRKVVKDIILREYFHLPLWFFSLGNLKCNDDWLVCLGNPAVSHFSTRNWWSENGYPVNAAVPQGSILGFTLFLLYTNLDNDVICNIAIYADDTTLCSKCYQASDPWEQLEMATELESDLWDIVNWGRKWLVDFNTGKTQLISFELFNDTRCYWCENGWFCSGVKTIFNMLGLPFSSKFNCGC